LSSVWIYMCKMQSWEKIFGSEHMLALHGIFWRVSIL